MGKSKWTKEQHDYLMNLYGTGEKNEWESWVTDMESKFKRSFTEMSLRNHIRYGKKPTDLPQYKENVEIMADGSHKSDKLIEMSEHQSKTPEYLLKAHGYDPEEWSLTGSRNSIWNAQIKGGGVKTLYASKISAKPRTEFNQHDFLKALNKKIKPVKVTKGNTGLNNLIIPLTDLHFPILTVEIASVYLEELTKILSKGYGEVVIEMLGDTFHSNVMRASQTIRGTILEDVDMAVAIEEAKSFFDIVITNAIANSSQVRIEYASGNHSDFEYMFCVYLEAKYPQIIVNKHLNPRTAFKLGNVGIMLTHGHLAKKKDYPMLFATEFKEIWSECDWKECHSGHYHTMESKNEFGIIHRQMGTLKPNDKYEEDNGFTMGYKTTQVLEYSEDKLKIIYDVG